MNFDLFSWKGNAKCVLVGCVGTDFKYAEIKYSKTVDAADDRVDDFIKNFESSPDYLSCKDAALESTST